MKNKNIMEGKSETGCVQTRSYDMERGTRHGIGKNLEHGDLYLKNNPQELPLTKKTVWLLGYYNNAILVAYVIWCTSRW